MHAALLYKVPGSQKSTRSMVGDQTPTTILPLHAGGLVQDALLPKQSASGLRAVLAPKLAGTQNLAFACARSPVDGFALFSSIASLLGNAGQTNYAAANAVLDATAALQQSQVQTDKQEVQA